VLGLAVLLAAFSAAASFAAPPPSAAAIERNLPPAPPPSSTKIAPPAAPLASDDSTPLGPTLSAIVILGPKDDLKTRVDQAVDTSDVARLDNPQARALLAPFVGRPISKKLVGEIAAQVVLYYRAQGFPFVSVTTPPQEITRGIVQFRVVEFVLDGVRVTGNTATPSYFILERLRAHTNEPIDANLLSQDLDELGRYPFRTIQVALAPGTEFGKTNLELSVHDLDPWRVYGGFANSGSPSTGWERFILGGSVGSLLTQDSLLSYQLTASTDFWFANGNPFGNAGHPNYLSNAVTFEAPTWPRQALEVTLDTIVTNAISQRFFEIGSRIYEGSLGYRLALSDYVDAPGDLRLGLEAKREERSTYFGTTNVADAAVEIYQLYAGWTDAWSDDWGRSSLDASVHFSPGGIDSANSGKAFLNFSNNAENSAQYAYASATFAHFVGLPYDLGLSTEVLAQVATTRLPDTGQMGLGGQNYVRGYTLDDGAYDDAIVLRNELRVPPFGVLAQASWANDTLAPFLFIDLGTGSALGAHHVANAGSVGLGADYNLGGIVSAGIDGAYAFEDAPFTKSGALRVEARVTISD
jgi:hemolysin activation/secretion protein